MGEINRYQGNTGRMRRIEEKPLTERSPFAPDLVRREDGKATGFAPLGGSNPLDALVNLLPGSLGELETDDIILMLILYLMYRESGDSELLIIMGAMFLL